MERLILLAIVLIAPQASTKLLSNIGSCADFKYVIPSSPELDKCSQCAFDDNGKLTCMCPDKTTLSVFTCTKYYSYPNCAGPIKVVDGQLSCKKIPAESTYHEHGCFACALDSTTLKCECAKAGREHVASELDLKSCHEPISNCKGVLTCGLCEGSGERDWLWIKAAAFGATVVVSGFIVARWALCRRPS